ncbi:MAG: zinc metalloprotease HtpX [Candidatus Bathyarchaeota archaeon]|nr:zinc metalloprotease HtpX [Candidatus Bathyarchaeota archaeon]
MKTWKLQLSMVTTLAVIFGLTTLVFTAVLTLANVGLSLITIGVLVVAFNIGQWLLAPYLVDAMYKVKAIPENEHPELHRIVEELSRKSKIAKPKLMLAQIPLPNAFAYGSPLSGNRVAITEGLLNSLNPGEVEAVIGHEFGHLKHRDVQVMLAVSFLPALFYFIGYSLLLSGIFGGNRRNGEGSNALIGFAFMAFSWLLTLFTLYLSRLREYYADQHSASVVDNGASKLSTGLAKIVHSSKNVMKYQQQSQQQQTNTSFKALFIANPDTAAMDSQLLNDVAANGLVEEILKKEPTFGEKLMEALSTHPNIVKRLRALKELGA